MRHILARCVALKSLFPKSSRRIKKSRTMDKMKPEQLMRASNSGRETAVTSAKSLSSKVSLVRERERREA